MNVRWLSACLGASLCLGASAYAGEASAQTRAEGAVRIPLRAAFTDAEFISAGVLGLGLGAFYTHLTRFNEDRNIWGEPLIGRVGPGSLDRWVGTLAWDRTGDRLHWGVPDNFPLVAMTGAAFFFAEEGATTCVFGRSLLMGDVNGDHAGVAFVEGFIYLQSAAVAAEYGIGRRRPYVDRDLMDTHQQPYGDQTSFFSGHAAIGTYTAAFLTRYIADRVESRWLAAGVGLALYGAATWTSYARVYEQAHYFTDVLTGMTAGALAGNLVYGMHFEDGAPIRRVGGQTQLLPVGPGGAGLTLTTRF